jgi:hypothetical protein
MSIKYVDKYVEDLPPDYDFSAEVVSLSNKIRPFLAGREPAVQSAVIADLLAIWLAGFRAVDEEGTERLRNGLLYGHVRLVRDLIHVNEEILSK